MSFDIRSPLFPVQGPQKSGFALENLNPYWAANRTKNPDSHYNVMLRHEAFVDSGVGTPGFNFSAKRKWLQHSVQVPVLCNTCNIKKVKFKFCRT